ncbi:MAG: hypothetical protein ABJH63_18135 [Rhizobiaceae bacterium]
MIRFVAIVILSASLSWLVLGYSMLQAQQIVHVQQDICLVTGSNMHKVYLSMLASLRREVDEWDEFRHWSDDEMSVIAPTIDAQMLKSQANLRNLESVSICSRQS